MDASEKGMEAMAASNSDPWELPCLPIDPNDVGRTYEFNSQSGKAESRTSLKTTERLSDRVHERDPTHHGHDRQGDHAA